MVRSKPGKIGFCQQHDDGFACVRASGTPCGDLLGVTGAIFRPLSESKTLKMAKPPYNSGWLLKEGSAFRFVIRQHADACVALRLSPSKILGGYSIYETKSKQ